MSLAMAATILRAVGYNPHRKYKASPADYVLVAAAMLVAIGLLVWAVVG